MFGKIMSISDELMWRYFELLSFKPESEIDAYKHAIEAGKNPRDVKFDLAEEIIARFHNQAAAMRAREDFIKRFQKGDMPDDMPEVALNAADGQIPIANLLKEAQLVDSTSDAMRMIKQGAVKIYGEKNSDTRLSINAGTTQIYQVGKRRFARVTVNYIFCPFFEIATGGGLLVQSQ